MNKRVPKISFICQKTIEIAFGGLFFLVPLFFTTINYELFEFILEPIEKNNPMITKPERRLKF